MTLWTEPQAIYVCGPMRGHDDLNFPAFDKAADELRAAGYDVFNPADHDREFESRWGAPPTTRQALTVDVRWICTQADGIAVLSGWEESLGAQAEVALARAIGLPVNFVSHWLMAEEAA